MMGMQKSSYKVTGVICSNRHTNSDINYTNNKYQLNSVLCNSFICCTELSDILITRLWVFIYI